MEKCPYCKGTGFIGTGFIEKIVSGHRAIYPYTEPCHCKVNVSISKKFGILSPVGSADPVDSDKVHELYGDKDIIFYGSEDTFLYLVKCYFLKGFMYKNYLILEGGTIVEQYNVPRDRTGDWLTTSHLNQYDMLAILFTTSARYTSLKDCVLEVIKNRNRLQVTTWIYSPSEDKLKGAREYTEEMDQYFENYKKIDLGTVPKMKGFVPRKMTMVKKEKRINQNLSNI